MAPSPNETSTSSCARKFSVPFGPFTLTSWPFTVTVTPLGAGIGFFPRRDILVDLAEEFTPDVRVTGGGVAHDAIRRRDDRDAEAVADEAQIFDRRIDAAARLRDAGDLVDRRRAFMILQLDLEFL